MGASWRALFAVGFVTLDDAPQKSESKSYSLLRRPEMGFINSLFTIFNYVSVRPTEAGDIILDPLPNIDATLAGVEAIHGPAPLASDVLVFFFGQNWCAAFITSVWLPRMADFMMVEFGIVVIA